MPILCHPDSSWLQARLCRLLTSGGAANRAAAPPPMPREAMISRTLRAAGGRLVPPCARRSQG
eukprot:6212488-Pleurochrysis_carterae.AAC.4